MLVPATPASIEIHCQLSRSFDISERMQSDIFTDSSVNKTSGTEIQEEVNI